MDPIARAMVACQDARFHLEQGDPMFCKLHWVTAHQAVVQYFEQLREVQEYMCQVQAEAARAGLKLWAPWDAPPTEDEPPKVIREKAGGGVTMC